MSDASDAVVLARRAPWSGVGFVVVAAVCVGTAGCRTSAWTPPSSWSMFGGQPKTADKLAASAQPPAAGDITKPSATAQPYPTTSTPQGYSLASGAASPAGQPAARTAAATEPAPVVYGSTPTPAPASYAAAGAPEPSASGTPPMSSISPQVGPYATSAAATSPDRSYGPPPSTPEALPYGSSPPDRIAANPPPSASAFTAPAASPAASPAAGLQPPSWGEASADAASSGSRYVTGGSRFSSPGSSPPPAMVEPSAAAWPAPPAAAGPPTPAAPPAPTAPPAAAAPPAAVPAGPTAPQRRPDPGYRPGRTSSYRPGPDMVPGERSVQPVSFSAPPPLSPPPQ